MDLAQLKSLGEVAGIGGLAIGAVVLLVRPLIDKLGILPPAQRGPLVRLIAGGAFGIGVLGIGAWLIAGMTGGPTATTVGSGSPAIIGAGNVLVGPTAPTPPATQPSPSALPTTGSAKTQGDPSPAIIGGGDVTVTVPSGVSPAQSR
jgi:hypothetical protein